MQTDALVALRRRHRGPVIGPDDAGYDPARLTFNGMVDRRPHLIARPLDVDDVEAAISYAVEADLPIAVRGGGHSVAGHCIGEGSVVVDLRLQRSVSVDPDGRTAICGGGALWEDLDPPCLRHGLATPGGTFGDTGVAGLTLGGGIGHLIGLHGLTLDNLLATTVVTAGGDVVRASEDDVAAGSDDGRCQQVVERQAVQPDQVADAATERQSGDAGVPERAAGGCEPMTQAR